MQNRMAWVDIADGGRVAYAGADCPTKSANTSVNMQKEFYLIF